MIRFRAIVPLAVLSLLGTNASGGTQPVSGAANAALACEQDAALSVMTYNVHGLPFPIAFQRDPALHEIGTRLTALRRGGQQPHVVLLQEAFTTDAKAIAPLAGYRYVALGPEPKDVGAGGLSRMEDVRRAGVVAQRRNQGKWV
jgi:hypothetical protein